MRERHFHRPGAPATLGELLEIPDVREDVVLRSDFGVMAIHGGDLEVMTDVIAATVAELGDASYYGVVYPPNLDRHLPSVSYQPDDSVALQSFLEHVVTVVSIHGYGRDERWTSLMLGGSNRLLAERVAAELQSRLPDYEMVTDLDRIPSGLRGLSARNPVNAPPEGGVQLELPPRVRGLSPFSPPPGPDGLSPPTRALIDGLAEVAKQWAARDPR
ncbi:MAG: poly-gamma-glutamate hydrolase family protein [Acidimicrobiales bacterium]